MMLVYGMESATVIFKGNIRIYYHTAIYPNIIPLIKHNFLGRFKTCIVHLTAYSYSHRVIYLTLYGDKVTVTFKGGICSHFCTRF